MIMLLSGSPTRSRYAVIAALAVLTACAWAYLVFLSARMGQMGSLFAMPMTSAWSGHQAVLMWTMWSVMMAGMMIPSAAPMISAYAKTIGPGTHGLHGSTAVFIAAYLLVWSGFSVLATGGQWALHNAGMIDAMGTTTSRWVGGGLLLAAGAYQFTGFKQACLRQCHSPLGFLLNHWRNGRAGSLVMGLHHGAVCVGCCWALMAVLFVLGVMNLLWIAVVAACVLLEKLVRGRTLPRIFGGLLAIWGAALMAGVLS